MTKLNNSTFYLLTTCSNFLPHFLRSTVECRRDGNVRAYRWRCITIAVTSVVVWACHAYKLARHTDKWSTTTKKQRGSEDGRKKIYIFFEIKSGTGWIVHCITWSKLLDSHAPSSFIAKARKKNILKFNASNGCSRHRRHGHRNGREIIKSLCLASLAFVCRFGISFHFGSIFFLLRIRREMPQVSTTY